MGKGGRNSEWCCNASPGKRGTGAKIVGVERGHGSAPMAKNEKEMTFHDRVEMEGSRSSRNRKDKGNLKEEGRSS